MPYGYVSNTKELLTMPKDGVLPLTQSHLHSLLHLLNPAPDNTPIEAFENMPSGSVVPMGADPVEGVPPRIPNSLCPMDINPVKCPQPDIFDHAEINTDRRNLLQVSMSVSSNKSAEFASTTATLPMIPEESKMQKRGSTHPDGKKKKHTNSVDSQDALPQKVAKPDQDADLHEAMSFWWGLPIVKSTLWSQIQNRHFHSGEFLQSSEWDCKFCDKILKINLTSKAINPKTVLHFKCGKEYQMKEPYNTANFRVHHQKCKGTPKSHKLPAGSMKKIDLFFAKASVVMCKGLQTLRGTRVRVRRVGVEVRIFWPSKNPNPWQGLGVFVRVSQG